MREKFRLRKFLDVFMKNLESFLGSPIYGIHVHHDAYLDPSPDLCRKFSE
jgi:hypothetical protein